ncbi:MAG TPA: hypothetical protein VJT54_15065 [Verrucomicrobiae bacterium]|nr:hypothetical protein [Verrucomicrobiae bacterium]
MKSELTISGRETEQWQKSFENKIHHEESLFRNIPVEILRDFISQFIALSEGEIVDHDLDEIALARRVSLLPKDKFFLIRQVTDDDLQESHN